MIKEAEHYFETSGVKQALGIPLPEQISFNLLGQGEYNANYVFHHPVAGQKLVFRINTGSQMHLEQQITYEYQALKALKKSGRTPQVYYVDDSREYLEYGVLVMEYLEGRPLRYETDMELAAGILADIHSVVPETGHAFLVPDNPLRTMHEECSQMAQVYLEWECARPEKQKILERLLRKAEDLIPAVNEPGTHIINTELNSGNFLINGPGRNNYLIDWEKPLVGCVEQDLAHFLAPTTTFWKTDCLLGREEMYAFLEQYRKAVDGRFSLEQMEERFQTYLVMTCLRGITWCAMAYVEYESPGRLLCNESTHRKIRQYMEDAFLKHIEQEFF